MKKVKVTYYSILLLLFIYKCHGTENLFLTPENDNIFLDGREETNGKNTIGVEKMKMIVNENIFSEFNMFQTNTENINPYENKNIAKVYVIQLIKNTITKMNSTKFLKIKKLSKETMTEDGMSKHIYEKIKKWRCMSITNSECLEDFEITILQNTNIFENYEDFMNDTDENEQIKSILDDEQNFKSSNNERCSKCGENTTPVYAPENTCSRCSLGLISYYFCNYDLEEVERHCKEILLDVATGLYDEEKLKINSQVKELFAKEVEILKKRKSENKTFDLWLLLNTAGTFNMEKLKPLKCKLCSKAPHRLIKVYCCDIYICVKCMCSDLYKVKPSCTNCGKNVIANTPENFQRLLTETRKAIWEANDENLNRKLDKKIEKLKHPSQKTIPHEKFKTFVEYILLHETTNPKQFEQNHTLPRTMNDIVTLIVPDSKCIAVYLFLYFFYSQVEDPIRRDWKVINIISAGLLSLITMWIGFALDHFKVHEKISSKLEMKIKITAETLFLFFISLGNFVLTYLFYDLHEPDFKNGTMTSFPFVVVPFYYLAVYLAKAAHQLEIRDSWFELARFELCY